LNTIQDYPSQSEAVFADIVDKNVWQLAFSSTQVKAKIYNRLLDYYGEVVPILPAPEGVAVQDVTQSQEALSARSQRASDYVGFSLKISRAYDEGVARGNLVTTILLTILVAGIVIGWIFCSQRRIVKKTKK
ncbi:MAG: hypothetical protein WCO23_04860, partial [bacterium]